jgi:hypothetical protein
LCATEGLQSCNGIRSGAVDVVVGTELLRQFRLVGAASNCCNLKPHVASVLDTQMTQTANAKHGNNIANLCPCVSESAERRKACAQQRRSGSR